MKKTVAGFVAGVVAASAVSVFAASISATENTFKVTVNGNEANIAGYNINGSSYFKLRDVADAVGGFSVGFENNTITITTNAPAEPGERGGERPEGEIGEGGQPSAEDMKTRLEQEVADGKITQEQADEMLSRMESGDMRPGNPPQSEASQN